MNNKKIKIQKIFISIFAIFAVLFLVFGLNLNIILAEECVDTDQDCITREAGIDKIEFNGRVIVDNRIQSSNNTSNKTAQSNISCDQQYPWCKDKATNIADLIKNFYKYALAVVGVTALGAIIWGGILYTVSAGNPSKQQEGIQWITGAVWGLVLLLGANLLLRTINLKLTNLELEKLKEVKVPVKETPKGSTVIGESKLGVGYFGKYYYENNPTLLNKATNKSDWTEKQKENLYSHDEAITKLNAAGIKVTSSAGISGVCADQSSSQCKTSFNGIPKDTLDLYIQSVMDFRQKNPTEAAKIQLTGGTESAAKHKEQGFGYPSLDTTYNKAYYDFVTANKDKYGAALVNENTRTSNSLNVSYATGAHTSFYTNEAAAKKGVGNIKVTPYTGGVR